MDLSVFMLQTYVVVATMVSVLFAAIAWLAFRARKKGEPPRYRVPVHGSVRDVRL